MFAKSRYRRFFLTTVTAISLLITCTTPLFAQPGGGGGGGHGEGGEDESPGYNLSFPNIFAEGVGLTGSTIDTSDQSTTGLRVVPVPPGHSLSGAFWYLWGSDDSLELCNPATQPTDCPPTPAPADLRRAFVQQDQNNAWQADWEAASTEVAVSTIDWGDNIESHTWSTKQRQIRVEVGLTKTVDPAMTGDLMTHLSGRGQTEMWGVISSNELPGTPIAYESTEATVFSPCSRLTIQKLYPDAADPGAPPSGSFTWNPASAQWDGPAYTVFNGAVWEGFGSEGPTVKFAAEVNIKGRIVYGFNWKVNDMVLPPSYRKVGWYRLTFSLDGTSPQGKQCGNYALNTSLGNSVIAISEEEGESPLIAAAEAGSGEDPSSGFSAHIDTANNLTYIDIYMVPGLGESVDNHAPICNAGGAYSLACAGLATNVFLSADGSFDPDGDPLAYNWTHDCLDGELNDAGLQNPVLGLTRPGTGIAQTCIVNLKVTELDLSAPLYAECAVQVSVDGCPVDCFGTPFGQAALDLCGKCGGSNGCLDCTGKPFGTVAFDRCGVCGGSGSSCLGCTGIQVGPVLSEIKKQTRRQQTLVKRAVLRLRELTGDKHYASKLLRNTNRLTANNFSLDTIVDSVLNECSNMQYCVRQDHSSSLKEFKQNANRLNETLRLMSQDLVRRGNGELGQTLTRRGTHLLRRIRRRVAALPATKDVCF